MSRPRPLTSFASAPAAVLTDYRLTAHCLLIEVPQIPNKCIALYLCSCLSCLHYPLALIFPELPLEVYIPSEAKVFPLLCRYFHFNFHGISVYDSIFQSFEMGVRAQNKKKLYLILGCNCTYSSIIVVGAKIYIMNYEAIYEYSLNGDSKYYLLTLFSGQLQIKYVIQTIQTSFAGNSIA